MTGGADPPPASAIPAFSTRKESIVLQLVESHNSMTALQVAMAEISTLMEDSIQTLMPPSEMPEAPLIEAMRYGTLGGGKRLRPFLAVATADMFGVSRACSLRVATAIEFVHCYSLIHDDLPAMDDGQLRRGRPTVHKQFDEATAILAGDALLARAFEVLADPDTHEDPRVRIALVAALSRAAGAHGMVGGQMLDLMGEKTEFSEATITRLQRLKTGELIAVACEAGAILGRADATRRMALRNFAHDLGLAFQIADDLLDIEGRENDVGKSVGRDATAGKATFISILGLERARDHAGLLSEQAKKHLSPFGEKARLLEAAAEFVILRRT